jgi:hypothetical protein
VRTRVVSLLLAGGVAITGCAATPAAVESPAPAPVVMAPTPVAPAPAPLIESPPIEPVPPPVAQVAQAATEPVPVPPPTQVVTVPSTPATAPPPAPIVVTAEPSAEEKEFAALLADLQRYNTLGGDELRREQQSLTAALTRTRSDAVRVRLAVLHTLTRQSLQDDQRALALFDAVVKNAPGSAAVRQLAAVLSVQVAERVRAVRDEQARSEAALQKLEALRAMERSLLRDRVRSGGGGGAGSGGGN